MALVCSGITMANTEHNAPDKRKKFAFSNWIENHVKYPKESIDKKEEGTVYVSFSVTEDFKIENIEVVQGISENLDLEAVNGVKSMPASEVINNGYQPGKTYILPIKFDIR